MEALSLRRTMARFLPGYSATLISEASKRRYREVAVLPELLGRWFHDHQNDSANFPSPLQAPPVPVLELILLNHHLPLLEMLMKVYLKPVLIALMCTELTNTVTVNKGNMGRW